MFDEASVDVSNEIKRLKSLIVIGKKLGFADDVAHHTAELEKLEND